MNDRGKSDSPVHLRFRRTIPGSRVRRRGREGGCPRGTRPAKRAPDAEPGKARPVRWIACAKPHGRTGTRSSPRSCITSMSIACERRIGRLKPKAAPGVDGVTWRECGLDLEANLRDLHAQVHRGSYRAKPVRRAYIPKRDGRLRPLGVARDGYAP